MLEKVIAALEGNRFRFTTEADLQEGIAGALVTEDLWFVREHVLGPHDRVDFWVGASIALEVKIDGSLSEITRQVHRYAQHADVKAIVLATSRRLHDHLPDEISGKPVRVVVVRLHGMF